MKFIVRLLISAHFKVIFTFCFEAQLQSWNLRKLPSYGGRLPIIGISCLRFRRFMLDMIFFCKLIKGNIFALKILELLDFAVHAKVTTFLLRN